MNIFDIKHSLLIQRQTLLLTIKKLNLKNNVMKKKYSFLVCMTILAWSCEKDHLSSEIEYHPKVELTQQEFISIAYDNPRCLTEVEALQLVRDFEGKNNLSRSKDKQLSIKRKYSLARTCTGLGRSTSNQQTIPMYDIAINDGTNNGLAIVAADERVAGVIAYIPKIAPEKEQEQRSNNFMLAISEASMLNRLSFVDSIRITMKDSTLQKLSNELGIPVDEIVFEKVKNNINIKSTLSRSKPENINFIDGERYCLEVDWGQEEPYNLALPTYTDPDFDWVTYHYPLGCSVTALMMVYSYFEPSIQGYDNGEKMIIDWTYLKQNRKIINPDYGISGDPEWKLRMVSRLGLWIYNGTNTKTKFENDVYQSFTSRNEISDNLNLYGIAHDPIKEMKNLNMEGVRNIVNDLKNYKIAIMGATRRNAGPNVPTATGNHVWVLDGYVCISKPAEIIINRDYFHANMGWNGSYNGWYLASTSYAAPNVSFETGNGNYDTDFWVITKLRK